MKSSRLISHMALIAAAVVTAAVASAAPYRSPGPGAYAGAGAGRHYAGNGGGHHRPGHGGGHYRPGHGGGHYGGHAHGHGHHWGWGLGLAVGVPWALGWYDPIWWGAPAYPVYPAYAYPGYRYGGTCGLDEDCWRAQQTPDPATAPTTEVAPLAAGEGGGPTQRPLHLNYCESARAWFPHVRSCPGGWRLVRPEYNANP